MSRPAPFTPLVYLQLPNFFVLFLQFWGVIVNSPLRWSTICTQSLNSRCFGFQNLRATFLSIILLFFFFFGGCWGYPFHYPQHLQNVCLFFCVCFLLLLLSVWLCLFSWFYFLFSASLFEYFILRFCLVVNIPLFWFIWFCRLNKILKQVLDDRSVRVSNGLKAIYVSCFYVLFTFIGSLLLISLSRFFYTCFLHEDFIHNIIILHANNNNEILCMFCWRFIVSMSVFLLHGWTELIPNYK